MSQTLVIPVATDTTTASNGTGCGQSKHLYVGQQGTLNYTSYVKFTIDWAGNNIRRLISATLNVYSDEFSSIGPAGEIGIMDQPTVPLIGVYRCASAFTVGNNVDGHFDSGDYTLPHVTLSGAINNLPTPQGPDLLHHIDVTSMVRAWAPSTVEGGLKAPNYGFALRGDHSLNNNMSLWSSKHSGGGGAAERPTLTLVYDLGPTTPNTPANLIPSGTVATLTQFEGDFSDVKAGDTLQSTDIEIYDSGVAATGTGATNRVNKSKHLLHNLDAIYVTAATGGGGIPTFTTLYVRNATTNDFQIATTKTGAVVDFNDYSAITYSVRLGSTVAFTASQTNRVNAHFIVPKPTTFTPRTGVTYRWRARYKDNEAMVSGWTALVSFNLSDTPPNAPTLKPVSGTSVATLNLLKFQGGTFSDPDGGDRLFAHQIQLSPFPQGDIRWDEADGILWDSGKTYEPSGATSWTDYYGGRALAAGTYYWRAAQWDQKDGVSAWTYAQLILTAAFSPDPASYDKVQTNDHAPWRIRIHDLYQPNGITRTVGRAPGNLIAVFEEAKNPGASVVYNSPGELHFTLLKDDEQIDLVEPKETHYAVDFYSGDGWQEKFAGVVWDADATETDIVFKGIDYVALYDTVIDERYDPLKPNKSYKNNGSFYENVTIRNVVLDQLNRAKGLTDSWVGFIAIGAIATMNEFVTVYSTMQPTLTFVSSLLDSHRQGTGKRTRIKVVKTTTGTYQVQIVDDPGTTRSDLALYYGELVQGYRVIVFGDGWANVQHVVGRNRDGVKVTYNTLSGQPFQPSTSVYGRIATVAVMDGVTDQNDLARRGLQAAIHAAKLGKNIAMGIRTEELGVLQGYDVCDVFPVQIKDGAIDTTRFGSGLWTVAALAWEGTDLGQQSVVLTFLPREDATAPNPDLLVSHKVSTQREWQLGWKPPDPLLATSLYYKDDKTGIVYIRNDSTGTLVAVTGTA